MTDSPAAEENLVARLGEKAFVELAAAFYRRVSVDELLGAMYPRDELSAAEQRLGAFLVQRFGGPAHYSAARGHPRLRMRHAPFAINRLARDRWIALMRDAMREQVFPDDIVATLNKYFDDTATFMMNRP